MHFQDNADMEFSVIKTAIARYLKRSNNDSPDYIEIKDSKSVVEFGRQHLLIPSKKADLQRRIFKNIPPRFFLKGKMKPLKTLKHWLASAQSTSIFVR